MKRPLLVLGALMLPVALAPAANAAYPSYPAAPPVHSCTTTTSSLSTWQTNVNTAASGTTQCLANGTYTGPVTINRTAAGTVTAASVSGYGAVIDAGTIHNGGSVTYQGLDLKNTTSGAGTNGDCFSEAAGVTAAVKLTYSKIHACNRMGVQMKNAASLPSNFTLDQSYVYDIGNTDQANGIGVVIRNEGGSFGYAYVTNNDISDGPNDAINVCGNNINIVRNYVHDMTAGTGLHNDVIQNTTTCKPVFALIIERVRTRAIAGSDAHFLLLSGTANIGATVRSNEIVGIGSGSHSIILGDATNGIQGADVQNNTIYGSGSVEFNGPSGSGSLTSNVFRNCTDTTDGAPWVVSPSVSVTVSNNTGSGAAANCTASGTGAANRDPLFVNAATGDFHLSSGSPEHDTGTGSVGGADIDDGARIVGTINRGSDED